jgi:elongation factor P
MSVTHGLRKGMVIRHAGDLFTVLDYAVVQSGKQKPTVHVKLRSLKSGQAGERSLDELGKIDEVPAEVRSMQYLYAAGPERVFMDVESFEQYSLAEESLGPTRSFLVEEESYRVQTIDGQPVGVLLPPAVVLTVVDTAPVEHGGGGSSVTKEARLNSGLTVRVPLFIKNGDKIRVGTDKHEYQGKEH